MQIIGAATRLLEQMDEHRTFLRESPIFGRGEEYLIGLSAQMTSLGGVMIGDGEARAICASVSLTLKCAGQIAAAEEPSLILDNLCSHHVLGAGTDSGLQLRFAHQLYQQFYAALHVRRELTNLAANESDEQKQQFARDYINKPVWEESLRMVAEELGRGETQSELRIDRTAVTSLLVEIALTVDPVLAGDLFRLCGIGASARTREILGQRLRTWYQSSEEDHRRCALAGMLATGAPDFADIIRPLMTSSDQNDRFAAYSTGRKFRVSCLGTNWREIVAGWTEEARCELAFEIGRERKPVAALELARTDPSLHVRLQVIRALAWNGAEPYVVDLMDGLTEADFKSAIQNLEIEDIPTSLRERAINVFEHLLSASTDLGSRLKILLNIAKLGGEGTHERVKRELTESVPEKHIGVEDLLRRAIDFVREQGSEWTDSWLTARVTDGSLSPHQWLDRIREIPESLMTEWLEEISIEKSRSDVRIQKITAVFAVKADAGIAATMFSRLCGCRSNPRNDPNAKQNDAIYSQLYAVFHAIPAPVRVAGLLSQCVNGATATDLRVAIDVFSRRGPEEVALRELLPDNLRQRFREYLLSGFAIGLNKGFDGELNGRLASVLAMVGEPQDVVEIRKLINDDLERARALKNASAHNSAAHLPPGTHSDWLVQAVISLNRIKADEILLEVIHQPEYELDAARGLIEVLKERIAPNAIVVARLGTAPRDYRTIWATPVVTYGLEPRRGMYAETIKTRIADHLARLKDHPGTKSPFGRGLEELAVVIATLDPEGSVETVLNIFADSGPSKSWTIAYSLEALLFGGVALPTDKTLALVNLALAQICKSGRCTKIDLLKRFLCLLPFLDDPKVGVSRVREVLSEIQLASHELRELLTALAYSRCDEAVLLILELASYSQVGLEHIAREWIHALAASPFPSAKAALMSFVDPRHEALPGAQNLPKYADEILAARIAEMARTDVLVRNRILELCSEQISASKRLLLAKIIAALQTPESALAGLNLLNDEDPSPIPYDLWRAIESQIFDKRPSDESTNAYFLVPRDASETKRRTFEMVCSDRQRKNAAWAALGWIEASRIANGRPDTEIRHPALETGKLWPPIAEAMAPIVRNAEAPIRAARRHGFAPDMARHHAIVAIVKEDDPRCDARSNTWRENVILKRICVKLDQSEVEIPTKWARGHTPSLNEINLKSWVDALDLGHKRLVVDAIRYSLTVVRAENVSASEQSALPE